MVLNSTWQVMQFLDQDAGESFASLCDSMRISGESFCIENICDKLAGIMELSRPVDLQQVVDDCNGRLMH
jgi:hypothetical protein